MSRIMVSTMVALLWTATICAQDNIQRGKIKKVDADKSTVTITVGDKDVDVVITKDTRVVDGGGKQIAEPFKDKGLAVGASVVFKLEQVGGKDVLVGLRLGGDPAGEIRRGTVKKFDPDKLTITLAVGGKEETFTISEKADVPGKSKDLKEKLKDLKEGAEVQFRSIKNEINAMRLPGARGVDVPLKVDTSELKPLTEMGTEEYQGHKGGLYPDGKNERPAAHEAAGVKLAKQVQPLDAAGKPSAEGKIVLLSVGMSNTSQVSQGFQRLFTAEKDKNPKLVFVNGAQGGQTAVITQKDDDNAVGTRFWNVIDDRLKTAGVTREQVQVVWIKQADAGPSEGFPGYAQKLQRELVGTVQVVAKRYPNLKLCYLSSRTYGGYATSRLNPEPYAYESAFSVRWLIEQQLKGDAALNYDASKGAVKAPWLSWGPYFWANGMTKRADGHYFAQEDFTPNDGTHLMASAQEKTGKLLLEFLKTDSTAKGWFLAPAKK